MIAGRTPAALTEADDLLLDLQCLSDSEVLNTGALLDYMDEADDDGQIDAEEWAYINRHVRLEHKWNHEQLTETRELRGCMTRIGDLVGRLRQTVHEMKKAALPSGRQTN